MLKDNDKLAEVLNEVFKNLTVNISRNHNPQASDTWVLSVVELRKNFIFDSQTGKFLGAIDMPQPAPQEYARGPEVYFQSDPSPSAMNPFELLLGTIDRATQLPRNRVLHLGMPDPSLSGPAAALARKFGPRE